MRSLTVQPAAPPRGAIATVIVPVLVMLGWLAAGPAPADEAPPAPTVAPSPIAVPAYRQANQVGVLTVSGPIDGITLKSLERRLQQALDDGAGAIVVELDTPGGEMSATLDICNLLKTDTPANTVAWVNSQAFSAGTIIALACREILVAPNATFGDAAPIAAPLGVLISMPDAERAKLEAPLLREVIDSARRNHYDENLVQAFVSVGIELWLIENGGTGERVFVDGPEYERVFGTGPPTELTPVAPARGWKQSAPVKPWFNTVIPREDDQAAVDEATRRQRLELEQVRPPARSPLTESDRGRWQLLMQVIAGDRLLTVKSDEAKFYGLARPTTVGTDDQLKAYFGAQSVRRYAPMWSEGLVRFMTQPILRGLLIVVFLICLFFELSAPGLGVFGATAGTALLLLVGAPYLAGMAQWWDIFLIVLGLVLVAAELLVIPGFGVPGILGAIALLVGLVGTFITGDLTTTQGQGELATGLVTTLTSLFAAGIGIWLISRQLHSLPILNRLILRTEVTETQGTGLLQAMAPARRPALEPGEVGVAVTDLRPAGRAEFAGKMWDVKSVGAFIDQGTPIRVVAADRFVVEVEETEA